MIANIPLPVYPDNVTPYQRGFEDALYLRMYCNTHRRDERRREYDAGIDDGNRARRSAHTL